MRLLKHNPKQVAIGLGWQEKLAWIQGGMEEAEQLVKGRFAVPSPLPASGGR